MSRRHNAAVTGGSVHQVKQTWHCLMLQALPQTHQHLASQDHQPQPTTQTNTLVGTMHACAFAIQVQQVVVLLLYINSTPKQSTVGVLIIV